MCAASGCYCITIVPLYVAGWRLGRCSVGSRLAVQSSLLFPACCATTGRILLHVVRGYDLTLLKFPFYVYSIPHFLSTNSYIFPQYRYLGTHEYGHVHPDPIHKEVNRVKLYPFLFIIQTLCSCEHKLLGSTHRPPRSTNSHIKVLLGQITRAVARRAEQSIRSSIDQMCTR